MNDGPKYDVTEVVPSIFAPSLPVSGRPSPFMYWLATCPSKMFLEYVASREIDTRSRRP